MKSVIRTECLPKEQRVAIRRACKDEIKNHNRRMLKLACTRRMLKLACIALHQRYGFGRERLFAFIEEMSELSTGRTDDPVYWQHIDKLLIDTLKMEWDTENYEEMGE